MSNNRSYFTLVLDTTPPEVEIIAPWYTTAHADTHIYIIADELLDTWQEIYVIDSTGKRHDFIFDYEGDRLYGMVKFSQVASGIATIYARVRDEVHNISALVGKAIDIKAGAKVFVFTVEATMQMDVKVTMQDVTATEASQNVDTALFLRNIKTEESNRQIDTEVR